MVDFQKIALGEKIRAIHSFVLERSGDETDINKLTNCSM
jgi:hypothetical protein